MSVAAIAQPLRTGLRAPLRWGVVVGGVLQAASPLAFWWLDTTVVYPPFRLDTGGNEPTGTVPDTIPAAPAPLTS